jgi:hypothetical protein
MDFLGWYSTGDRPTLADIDIHRQITDINESPLFLQLSPGWLNDLFSCKLCVDHVINFSAAGIQSTCETVFRILIFTLLFYQRFREISVKKINIFRKFCDLLPIF